MVAVYDLVRGRTAERIRTKESMRILCQGKALLESTLWLERFPQAVLFRLKVILQDNGTRVSSPLAREGRGRGVKQTAINPLTPAHISVWIAEMDVLYVHPKGEGHGWPESLPLFRGRGVHVHHERKVRFRVKNLKYAPHMLKVVPNFFIPKFLLKVCSLTFLAFYRIMNFRDEKNEKKLSTGGYHGKK